MMVLGLRLMGACGLALRIGLMAASGVRRAKAALQI